MKKLATIIGWPHWKNTPKTKGEASRATAAYLSVLILVVSILLTPAAWSQGTDAVVSGNILDATGAIVPAAAITALNLNTGVKTVVTSNAS